MAEIKILVKGYVREKGKSEFASSTATLIKEGGLNIIVDPGMDRKLLLEGFQRERLSPDEINYVVLTHPHLDHSLLAGFFRNAKVLDDSLIYSWDGRIEKHDGNIPGTNVKIMETPGHDVFHCSVLVKTKEYGAVAVVGDVFWWADREERKTDKESLMKRQDPYAKNVALDSRLKDNFIPKICLKEMMI